MTERIPDDFVEALRVAEDYIAESNPPSPDHQRALLQAMIAREARRPARRMRAWLFGGAGALVTATAALALAWPHLAAREGSAPTVSPTATDARDAPEETSALARLGLSPECDTRDAGDDTVALPAGCAVSWTTIASSLETAAPTTLSAAERGLTVRAGEVTFDVNPDRPNKRLARVVVSGGVIEVLGTRFTVVERGEDGEVTLHRGSIRFVPTSGEPRTLSPGESHTWGEATAQLDAPNDAPLEDAPEPPARVEKKPRVIAKKHTGVVDAAELTRLRELRRLKRYDEALGLIKKMARRDLDRPTLEVLNYERGELLGLQGKTRAACAHWKRHQRRFSKGAYSREVRRHISGLECGK